MGVLKKRLVWELILALVLLASLVIALRQSHRLAVYRRQQISDAQALKVLEERVRQSSLPAVLPLTEEGSLAASDHAEIVRREATIARLDHELAESHATIANLQTQVSTANDQIAQAQSTGDERARKQQADTQAQIDELQKKIEAAQSASDIARQRTAVLEADNAQIKTDSTSVNARAADIARIISNLQDLDRRRDVYLTSILRRYRDLTDEFHAMSGMIDTSHEPSSGVCGGAALSRIQTAVTSAEDDLRQMNELSARSQKLEKQLMKK